MKLSDINRRGTTREERRAIRAEYNSWRRGDIEIQGWTWKRWRKKAYGNQRGKCYYCQKGTSIHKMQVDHRVAVYYGGPNDLSNFILACQPCNSFKAQHVLLRNKDRVKDQMSKATILRHQKPSYAEQERAYADAINAWLDESLARRLAE